MFETITIIGVGLIGGSIGLAVKKNGLVKQVIGVGRNNERLKLARQKGAIDNFTTDIASGVKDSQLVILGLPVEKIIEVLAEVAENAPEVAIVTDVGSTKLTICAEAEKYFNGERAAFIGSHPLAGSEKTGVEFASAELFRGATCFVTVTEKTNLAKLRLLVKFWQELGARPFILRPERHDSLVAASSHAVHLAAAGIANALANLGDDLNLIRLIVGTGFKDTTRIAKGDVQLWLEICRQNTLPISSALEAIIKELTNLKVALDKRDFGQVEKLLATARNFRQQLDS